MSAVALDKPFQDSAFSQGGTGRLTLYTGPGPARELAIDLIEELARAGESVILVDADGAFDPYLVARWGRDGLDGRRFRSDLVHLIRTDGPRALVQTTMDDLDRTIGRTGNPHVLIAGVPDVFYTPELTARDASVLLGQFKIRIDQLTAAGTQIVVIASPPDVRLGLRTMLFSSLRSHATRVLEAKGSPLSGNRTVHLVRDKSTALRGSSVTRFPAVRLVQAEFAQNRED